MILFRKRSDRDFDIEAANQTLQNVFAACDRKPNTIPFETIIKQQKAKTAAVNFCMWVSLFFLLLTILSPLCFWNGSFKVNSNYSTSQYMTVVDHYMEGDCFTIILKGDNIDYDHITLIDEAGNKRAPDKVLPSQNMVCIEHPTGTTNISIPDTDGHTITAILSIQDE